MKDEIQILKQIRHQLAHCMAFYGDQPDELMLKLESLVIEWFEKGLNANKAINITCPHCHTIASVFHLEWTAIICQGCGKEINQLKQ